MLNFLTAARPFSSAMIHLSIFFPRGQDTQSIILVRGVTVTQGPGSPKRLGAGSPGTSHTELRPPPPTHTYTGRPWGLEDEQDTLGTTNEPSTGSRQRLGLPARQEGSQALSTSQTSPHTHCAAAAEQGFQLPLPGLCGPMAGEVLPPGQKLWLPQTFACDLEQVTYSL